MNDSTQLPSVSEALQNARIKLQAFRAAQTTVERHRKNRDHYKVLFEKAQNDYNTYLKDMENAREDSSNAKFLLFEAIERETF